MMPSLLLLLLLLLLPLMAASTSPPADPTTAANTHSAPASVPLYRLFELRLANTNTSVANKVRDYFLVFVQLFEKYGTLIERYTALIEKVSALIVQGCLAQRHIFGALAIAKVKNRSINPN
eukprot:SAG31_NODE_281_length_18584_cov_10.762564_13_plen_121_part_00